MLAVGRTGSSLKEDTTNFSILYVLGAALAAGLRGHYLRHWIPLIRSWRRLCYWVNIIRSWCYHDYCVAGECLQWAFEKDISGRLVSCGCDTLYSGKCILNFRCDTCILVSVYWLLDATLCILVSVYWLLDATLCILVSVYWLLDATPVFW